MDERERPNAIAEDTNGSDTYSLRAVSYNELTINRQLKMCGNNSQFKIDNG